MISYTWICVCD